MQKPGSGAWTESTAPNLLSRPLAYRPLSSVQESTYFPRGFGGIWLRCVWTVLLRLLTAGLPSPDLGSLAPASRSAQRWGPIGTLKSWSGDCARCPWEGRRQLELGRSNQTASTGCCPRGWSGQEGLEQRDAQEAAPVIGNSNGWCVEKGQNQSLWAPPLGALYLAPFLRDQPWAQPCARP